MCLQSNLNPRGTSPSCCVNQFLQYGSRAAMYYTALNSADSVLSKRYQAVWAIGKWI